MHLCTTVQRHDLTMKTMARQRPAQIGTKASGGVPLEAWWSGRGVQLRSQIVPERSLLDLAQHFHPVGAMEVRTPLIARGMCLMASVSLSA